MFHLLMAFLKVLFQTFMHHYPRTAICLFFSPNARFRVNHRSLLVTSFAILNSVELCWPPFLEEQERFRQQFIRCSLNFTEYLRGLHYILFSSMDIALDIAHNFLSVLGRNIDDLVSRLNHHFHVISGHLFARPLEMGKIKVQYFNGWQKLEKAGWLHCSSTGNVSLPPQG